MFNPCLDCGACCAFFRVSFYWGETSLLQMTGVPETHTEKLDAHRVAMRGTNQKQPRCLCLQGKVGEAVSCAVYEQRPSPCREFDAGSERCLKARMAHGLGAIDMDEVAISA